MGTLCTHKAQSVIEEDRIDPYIMKTAAHELGHR